MIPLAVPNLSGNERNYLNQCIDTTFVSSVGEFVTRIEKMGADACGVKYGVATSAGTTGLHLALMGCGVKRDAIVIIPTFTFIATANAVAHCGAVPWLMDIDSGTWTMDAGQLEKELSTKTEWRGDVLCHKRTGRRVAAIMPIYTLGNLADMKILFSFHGIPAHFKIVIYGMRDFFAKKLLNIPFLNASVVRIPVHPLYLPFLSCIVWNSSCFQSCCFFAPGPSAAMETPVSSKVFISLSMWSAASMTHSPRHATPPSRVMPSCSSAGCVCRM